MYYQCNTYLLEVTFHEYLEQFNYRSVSIKHLNSDPLISIVCLEAYEQTDQNIICMCFGKNVKPDISITIKLQFVGNASTSRIL